MLVTEIAEMRDKCDIAVSALVIMERVRKMFWGQQKRKNLKFKLTCCRV